MNPNILVYSYNERLYQSLHECLGNQYEIIYCDAYLMGNKLINSGSNIYLYVIEAFGFNKEMGKLVKKLKKMRKAPILFLSKAMADSQRREEKVEAINHGVDEYLTHPQSVEEILASIKALIRWHIRVHDNMGRWEYQGLRFFAKSRQVFIDDEEIPLTKTEYDILQYLASQDGRAVSYKELYEKVWKHEYICDDINIMEHIHRLRKKLERNPKKPQYIHNVYGIGYRFGSRNKSKSEKKIVKGDYSHLHPLNCMV